MTEKNSHQRWNLIKRLHKGILTVEHDRNMDQYDQKYINKIYCVKSVRFLNDE